MHKNRTQDLRPAKHLPLTVIIFTLLSLFGIAYYIIFYINVGNIFHCDETPLKPKAPSGKFIIVFTNTYLRKPECDARSQILNTAGLPNQYFFISFTALSTSSTILCAIVWVVIVLFLFVKPHKEDYIEVLIYTLNTSLAINIASDIALTILYLISYLKLNTFLDGGLNDADIYEVDSARTSAILFLCVAKESILCQAIKGLFVFKIINYYSDHKKGIKEIQSKQEHSIHQKGPIAAYQASEGMSRDIDRRHHLARRERPGFVDPRNTRAEIHSLERYENRESAIDYPLRDRSVPRNDASVLATEWSRVQRPNDSWPRDQWSRDQWSRDQWPPHPVPKPDYSPQPRRLKEPSTSRSIQTESETKMDTLPILNPLKVEARKAAKKTRDVGTQVDLDDDYDDDDYTNKSVITKKPSDSDSEMKVAETEHDSQSSRSNDNKSVVTNKPSDSDSEMKFVDVENDSQSSRSNDPTYSSWKELFAAEEYIIPPPEEFAD